MNFFTNSILNIILTMFNSVFSDLVLFGLSAFILFENIYGMYYTYKICKGKVKYPILYVIPVVREIAVLASIKKIKYQKIRNVGIFLLVISGALYIACLITNMYPEGIAYICIISLTISTVLFAIVNSNFIFSLHKETKSYYGILAALGLYLVPLFTLMFLNNEIEDEEEKKKRKSNKAYKVVSKVLALVILINTIYGSAATCYASELPNHTVYDNRIETGCEICNNASEKILLPLEIQLDFDGDYLKCYAVTCKDCEIFHVFEDEDLDFPNTDDLGYNYKYYCAYFDFSNTSLKTGDNYNGLPFEYYPDKHFATITCACSNAMLAHNEEYYYNGIKYRYYYDADTIEYYDDANPNSKYFFNDELLYRYILSTKFNGAAEFDEKSSDAVKCYPKNSNFKPGLIYQNDNVIEKDTLSNKPAYSEDDVDNEIVNDYTSNNNTYEKTYDNKFNTNNFVKKSVEKSLVAVAVTGSLALLSAVTAPVWGTALATTACIAGTVLITFWLCERGYEFVKLFTDDYSCKEEQEAATYRFLEETTSDLVAFGVGYACSRTFGNLVDKYKNAKTTQDLIDYENAKLPKLNYQTDYENYQEAFEMAKALKANNNVPTSNMKFKGEVKQMLNSNQSVDGIWIGGNVYKNSNGMLPIVSRRVYYEADVSFNGVSRGAERLVWSNDGYYYYSPNHYNDFYLLEGFYND